jgi:hypothetical protein
MKEWQINLVGAAIIIAMGAGMMFWASSIEVPARYRTFLGIPYDINPDFVFAFQQMLMLLISGCIILGMGAGILLNTYTIYKLEKKLASKT